MAGARVVIVGLGNIGSHLARLLAGCARVSSFVLCDFDRYGPENLATQAIAPGDVGAPKVEAQARALRSQRPDVEVVTLPWRVEDVPPGLLRADVLLGALDSRAARRTLNALSFHLQVPWVDAGVHAAGRLARVRVYLPGRGDTSGGGDPACLECAWTEVDYEALGTATPCQPRGPAAPPTGAPSSLGAAAAALAATECEKLLSGAHAEVAGGREVVLDLRAHRLSVTRHRRNPACRFDHRAWFATVAGEPSAPGTERALPVPTIPGTTPLAELLAPPAAGVPRRLSVPEEAFARDLACRACGLQQPQVLRLTRALRASPPPCPRCRADLLPVGFTALDVLDSAALPSLASGRTLGSIGIGAGEVLELTSGRDRVRLEVGPGGAPASAPV